MDWSNEHRYDVLIADPDAKQRIQQAGVGVHAPMSHEEWLALMMPVAVGGDRLATKGGLAGARFGHRMALKLHVAVVRKERRERPWPVGESIVAVLCSMAHRSLKIQAVEQHDDGCEITAEVPSDRHAYAGTLWVVISQERASGSLISATAKNPGGVFDGGRARATLTQLFSDVNRFAASWGSTVGPS